MMHPICMACGTQFAEAQRTPEHCPLCEDERQYTPADGQKWTTLEHYRQTHRNVFAPEEPDLFSIHPKPVDNYQGNPRAGIGQRAFLVCTKDGNVLWDCVAPLDDATIEAVNQRGGLKAIAISHPHFYTTMVQWSSAFGDVPIYLHSRDAEWVSRPSEAITFWDGASQALFGGLTLVHTGGHFAGSQVLHWQTGADDKGVLLTADEPYICADQRWVTFMRSFPNLIPLGPSAIRNIIERLQPFAYDRIYGAFPGQIVQTDAQAIVARSADRYLRAISI